MIPTFNTFSLLLALLITLQACNGAPAAHYIEEHLGRRGLVTTNDIGTRNVKGALFAS
ncbi:hypothetical protein MD484_g8968, partial [Candolleomyces efflorescens]